VVVDAAGRAADAGRTAARVGPVSGRMASRPPPSADVAGCVERGMEDDVKAGSWWVGVSRDEFVRRLAIEQERIRSLGSGADPVASDMARHRRTRKQRADDIAAPER